MCLNDPNLGGAVGAGASVAQFVQADRDARNEDQYNKKVQSLGSMIAVQNAESDWSQLARRRDQEREAANQAFMEFASGVDSDRSTARLAGLESGASGATLGAIVDSYTASRLRGEVNHRVNQRNADDQYLAQAHGVGNRLRSTLFELTPRKAQRPSPFGALMDAGGNYLDAYSKYKKAKKTD